MTPFISSPFEYNFNVQKSFHRIISKRLPSLKQWVHGLGLISCVFLIIVFWSMKELRRCSPLYQNLLHLAISQIFFTVAFWACQGWVPFQTLPSSTGTLRYVFENVFRIVARLYCAKNSLILAFGMAPLRFFSFSIFRDGQLISTSLCQQATRR